ncbi:L2 [Gammapapillomavirus sp.]|uniref:L2 n=1 Tax=Gammapapillomavirus sp. TaxID=2049444 RepID=UPI000C49C08B|nr:L2 [Gammapapillomavirus sp.]ATQ38173.1 L2 [Gammapapillomavirus sp.]
MNGNRRSKRDTVENLYKSCRLGGDCPPDVVNKVERKTLADILLQTFSSILYLGGLGIGTGKGATGNVSVRPIPELPTIEIPSGTNRVEEIPLTDITPTRRIPSRTQERPFSVPIDRIGAGFRPRDPTGARPIDVIDPASPAVVTLQENLPDSVITLTEPNLETGESVVTNIDIITDTTSIQSHPTVFQSIEDQIAILSVTPADPPVSEVVFSAADPSVNPFVSVQSIAGHIDPSINVFVDPNLTGDDILFGEEIPLEPINPRSEFEIEEYPQVSTPEERIQRAFSRVRHFYRQHIQQVRTSNLNLLGDVSRAVEFGFENPAFDPEVSVEFQRDVTELAAAPDADYAGLQRISRPYFSETPEGTVRVSRIGQRAGMRTRSGTVLSQDIHYFYDISRIPNVESIELLPLSEITEGSAFIDPEEESVFINELNVDPENVLLDSYNNDFSNAHLIFNNTEIDDDTLTYPTLISDIGIRTLPTFSDIFISEQNQNQDTTFNIPLIPINPVEPPKGTVVLSYDFYLHPSLSKKKKRKRKYYF